MLLNFLGKKSSWAIQIDTTAPRLVNGFALSGEGNGLQVPTKGSGDVFERGIGGLHLLEDENFVGLRKLGPSRRGLSEHTLRNG